MIGPLPLYGVVDQWRVEQGCTRDPCIQNAPSVLLKALSCAHGLLCEKGACFGALVGQFYDLVVPVRAPWQTGTSGSDDL